MAWDLWGTPYDPVAEESSFYHTPTESRCDFYFAYGFDVIEEEALNEKSCTQVLQILIAKADEEIDELEQDLVYLQSELALAENEEWSEICSNALREKIDFLDVSMRTLRNKDKNDVEVHLLMHTQSAETLHDILKCLLRNYPHKKDEQPGITSVQDFHPHSLTLVADHSEEKKLSSNSAVKSSEKGDAKENSLPPEKRRMVRGGQSVEMLKIQPAKIGVYNYDRRISTGEGLSVGSTLKPVIKADLCKKPTNVIVKDLGLNTDRHATGHSNGLKKFCRPDLKVTGIEEVRHHHVRATGNGKISSSLNSEGKGNCPRMDEPADAVVKNLSAEVLRHANEPSERKENSDSGLCSYGEAKSDNFDIEQKLCNFAVKPVPKRTVNTSKVAANDGVISLNSPLKIKRKKKNPPQILNAREASLTDTENCALTSLLELQDQKGKNLAKLQPKDEGKLMQKRVQMTEIATDYNSLKEKAKRSIKSNLPVLQEIGFSRMLNVSSCSISGGKLQQKSGVCPLKASLNLNQSLNGNTKKKVIQPGVCEVEDGGVAPGENQNWVPHQRKKRKKSANVPIILGIKSSSTQMDFSNSHQGALDGTSANGLSFKKSYLIFDSGSEAVSPLPYTILNSKDLPPKKNLKDLRLDELRALAKQHRLTKYHKLPKGLLLERLADQIGNFQTS